MIVRRLESPVYYRRKREGLPGKGMELSEERPAKSFEQYLLEAFEGKVVKEGDHFAKSVSPLSRENMIRLSQI